MDPALRFIYYQLKRQLAQTIEKRQALTQDIKIIQPYIDKNLRELDELIEHLKIQIEFLKKTY